MFIICIDFLIQKNILRRYGQNLLGFNKKGKIKGKGISQATSEEIERCNAVTCVKNEYSMMERMHENEIKTCEKLGILFIACSPMSSGFLSGKYNKDCKYKGDDVRRCITRFKTDNVVSNQL